MMPIRITSTIQRAARLALVPLLAALLPTAGLAQSSAAATGTANGADDWRADAVLASTEFVTPPDDIAEAVLAPRYLNVTLSDPSPDHRWFLNEVGDGPVGMDVFSRPFHELGGLFIDYAANRDRRLTIRNNVGIELISAADGAKTAVQIPDGARVSSATWSPDGRRVAFFAHFDDATHIYVADADNGRSRQITRRPVLATLNTSFEWTADGEAIATVLVPENRSAMPVEPRVPTGPQVKLTEDAENRLRTYASLMETPHDEALLEWHATGQLALIDVDSRRITNVGAPTMVRSFEFAPGGDYAMVTRMVRPFSYITPVSSFGRINEVWGADGTVLATLDTVPLNTSARRADGDDDANEGQAPERRSIAWSPDGQGLIYLQQEPAPDSSEAGGATGAGGAAAAAADAADEPAAGGTRARARRMDRVFRWLPPFDDSSTEVIYETPTRMAGVSFSEDMGTLFVAERQGQTTHQYAVFLDEPETKHTLTRWNSEKFYENPGALVSADGVVGGRFGRGGGGTVGTVLTSSDGQSVFLGGTVYSEDPMAEGPRTFVDRVAIRTGDKERIYESSNAGVSERISTILDADAGVFVVNRESPGEITQSYRVAGTERVQLTRNIDYTPDLTAAPIERFVVTRPDGFKFRVTVTLPPGYQKGTRLPAMFWFYPREYDDQESYDEGARTYNKNAFPSFGTRSMEYLVREGYAVVEPDAPIVGPAGQMNNNYEHDLRNNLAAVIDELDRRELIDRQRLGLGGHSYGAFSTVNAMVHTPFFKAGIAGDGNYNRTLTPMAFQSERRLLWEAKDVYLGMSPFLYANNLTGALLMYHGLGDQNVGTDPTHSPRLFHALNGLGKDAAMYLYPYEDHGPATRETILDLWGRWTAWLDVHLKNDVATRPITFDEDDGGGAGRR